MSERNHNYKIVEMLPADDWWMLFDWPDYDTYQEKPVVAFARIMVYDGVKSFPYTEQEWAEREEEGDVSYEVVPMVRDFSWDEFGTRITPYYSLNAFDLGRAVGLYKGKGSDILCGKPKIKDDDPV